MEALPKCKTMEQLEKKQQIQRIGMQYKYKGQTTEKQGVSFKIGYDLFKGSKVDRQLSLGNLEKTLASQQQNPDVKLKITESFTDKSPIEGKESKEQSQNSRV